MSTYVLVHGAWHGSWCWSRVLSLLRRAGHDAVALDLPGRAGDPTPHRDVTLASYADAVCQVVSRAAEPVVLVGHSLGGIAISQAAEACGERIRSLVYVCAYLLRDGESVLGALQTDTESLLLPYVQLSDETGSATLAPEAPLRQIFYGRCSEAEVAYAQAMLVPEPVAPAATALRLTAERFGRIPRVYVECLRDQTISLGLQRRMRTALPCEPVVSIDTDHSPFLSVPGALAAHLLALS